MELLTGSRWKGKGCSDMAEENPMSEIINQLKRTLTQSKTQAMLSGSAAILHAKQELSFILNQACFGHEISTSESETHRWFQLSLEEAFYLRHELQTLIIVDEAETPLTDSDLWNYMKAKKPEFPDLYMSYAHLRRKNWVVRSGAQYGADFVAYRHHPSLVHSNFTVVVIRESRAARREARLSTWPDLQCALRMSGSVAKTMLVLFVDRNGNDDASSPCCLQRFTVEERVVARWLAGQGREGDCDKD